MSVRYEASGGVARVVLDRSEVLNALDIAHLRALSGALGDAAGDESVSVVVITGAGRAFSVGADIKAMDRMGDAQFEEATALYQDLSRQARSLDKPIVAAINGYALGGGLEIALLCDLRIAAASASLGLPDAELGFSPTGGLTFILPRLIGAGRAMDLLLAAEPIDAREALRIGLVTRVFEDDAFDGEVAALAARIASWPRVGVAHTKRLLMLAQDGELETVLEAEARCDALCYRSEVVRAKLRAFVEERKRTRC